MPVEIIVALIGGGFAIVGELLRRLLRQNVKDHELVIGSLERVSEKVDSIKEDVVDLKGEHRWLRDRFLNHTHDD
jgi:uncharacterized membrane-anchored protein YhcB (DUF1043 family)